MPVLDGVGTLPRVSRDASGESVARGVVVGRDGDPLRGRVGGFGGLGGDLRGGVLRAGGFGTERFRIGGAGIDFLLVGDSAGNTVFGYDTTIPVTVDELIPLTAAVVRGVRRSLVIGDLPFGSYENGPDEALATATTWIDRQRAAWEGRLDRLERSLDGGDFPRAEDPAELDFLRREGRVLLEKYCATILEEIQRALFCSSSSKAKK